MKITTVFLYWQRPKIDAIVIWQRFDPIELVVENEEYFKTCKVNYREGEKYPAMERDNTKPDLLGRSLNPVTTEPDLK